jgi:hypothetical protein
MINIEKNLIKYLTNEKKFSTFVSLLRTRRYLIKKYTIKMRNLTLNLVLVLCLLVADRMGYAC